MRIRIKRPLNGSSTNPMLPRVVAPSTASLSLPKNHRRCTTLAAQLEAGIADAACDSRAISEGEIHVTKRTNSQFLQCRGKRQTVDRACINQKKLMAALRLERRFYFITSFCFFHSYDQSTYRMSFRVATGHLICRVRCVTASWPIPLRAAFADKAEWRGVFPPDNSAL